MKTMLLPVIMAGGTGSRLWPMSRKNLPKQLLKLDGDLTMLQATVDRLQGLPCMAPSVICNEDYRFMVAEQLRQMGSDTSALILEPVGRNTAPAIALAAIEATRHGDDPVMLVLAADHVIRNADAFRQCVVEGNALVEKGKIVTFGIVATHPETGYGYLKAASKTGASAVEAFVEKPDAATAQTYFDSGDYFWNSGMFMFKASRYLTELGKHRPDILEACQKAMANVGHDLDFTRVDADAFAACPSESIDYAVMEKAHDVWVVPMDAGWNDVGSWSALKDIGDKDANGNVCHGDIIMHNTSNSYIRAENKMIATVGLDNVIVVETKDAVLVANGDNAQDIKKIVDKLKAEKRVEHEFHREVYRPWGKYDSIDNGERYQVKRITVKPGEKLSVQMHHHRAEHWIVVSGTALVNRGDEEILLTENQSVYIPLGTVHALENPGKIPLELIEVQSGSYLGEDDIVRFNDRYGRV
jgi:mannose-1-phosphate guanylyltransferase/mannose-6-phosphate isomerase